MNSARYGELPDEEVELRRPIDAVCLILDWSNPFDLLPERLRKQQSRDDGM
jgi:hypothetical protein